MVVVVVVVAVVEVIIIVVVAVLVIVVNNSERTTTPHLLQVRPLLEELLERGHRVTSMVFRPLGISHGNYSEILLPSDLPELAWEVNKVLDGKQMVEKTRNDSKGNVVISGIMDPSRWWRDYLMMDSLVDRAGRATVEPQEVQEMLRSGTKVDAVLGLFPQMVATLAEVLDCPIIVFSPSSAPHHVSAGLGGHLDPWLQPLPTSPFMEPMTWRQRVQNTVLYHTSLAMLDWLGRRVGLQQQQVLGLSLPPHQVIIKHRSSIILAMVDPVTHGSWPLPPSTVPISGLQLHAPLSPPGTMEHWICGLLDSATHGAVLVSLGSSLQPHMMPEDKLAVLVAALGHLQYQVILRWPEQLAEVPGNVVVVPWVPQQQVLAHSNTKLFLSHGGLASITEALYHGTPLLAIPLSNDQKQNVLRAEHLGYVVSVEWEGLSVEGLLEGVGRALEPGVGESLARVGQKYREGVEGVRGRAARAVEQVCRHQGARWLQPSVHLEEVSLLQFYHLDLLLCVVVSVTLPTLLAGLVCRLTTRRWTGDKVKTT